jgi:hypothetical protein
MLTWFARLFGGRVALPAPAPGSAYETNMRAQLANAVSAGAIAPFAACHDGFIREAAIARCVALNRMDLLPLVVGRLNDWVPQVRDAARAGVLALAPVCSRAALLGILPGVLALGRARRSDHAAWIAGFEALLATRLTAQDLADGIAAPDIATSRAAFQLARSSGKIAPEDLIVLALARRNDVMLAQEALGLIRTLPPDLGRPWYERLATSHFLPLRVAALAARLHDASAAADALAVATLADRTASMRDVATRYLHNRQYDIHGFYRDLLRDPGTPVRLACIALGTLGALRHAADLPLVQAFAAAATPAVREAALAAWFRLAPGSKDAIALLALRDPAPGPRRFALTLVRRQGAYIPFAEARAILLPLQDYRRLLRLAEADQWQWLETLIELASAADAATDPAIGMALRTSAQAWQRQTTRYYTVPSPRLTALFDTPAAQHALQILAIPSSCLRPF